MYSNLWVEEKFEDFLGLRFKVEKVLFSGKSEYQTVDVVETKGHGKVLLNDGIIMLTERDEFAYHDMISHVPLFVHPDPKKVLIIGGGDGGTAREVLRHQGVESCVMVEIDAMVVDACKQFIPQTSCALDDPRLDLIIGDGVAFVKNTETKFDLIIVDSTDPIGPAQPLFGAEFYADVNRCLSDNGIVVSQGESSWYGLDIQQSLLEILGQHFAHTALYNFSTLGYPGGMWSFTYGAKTLDPIKDFDESRVQASAMKFRYYNAQIHKASFALPSFALEGLEGLIK